MTASKIAKTHLPPEMVKIMATSPISEMAIAVEMQTETLTAREEQTFDVAWAVTVPTRETVTAVEYELTFDVVWVVTVPTSQHFEILRALAAVLLLRLFWFRCCPYYAFFWCQKIAKFDEFVSRGKLFC